MAPKELFSSSSSSRAFTHPTQARRQKYHKLLSVAATLSIILTCSTGVVSAHSWLDCTNMLESGVCAGYPLGYPSRADRDINTKYTYLVQDRPPQASVCQPGRQDIPGNNPFQVAQVIPGQNLHLTWQPDGHLNDANPSTIEIHSRQIPGQQLHTRSELGSETLVGAMTFATSGNCDQAWEPNTWCHGHIVIPQNWTPGTYQLVWWWKYDRNPAGEEYSTCFEVVVGGAGNGNGNAPRAAAASVDSVATSMVVPTIQAKTQNEGSIVPLETKAQSVGQVDPKVVSYSVKASEMVTSTPEPAPATVPFLGSAQAYKATSGASMMVLASDGSNDDAGPDSLALSTTLAPGTTNTIVDPAPDLLSTNPPTKLAEVSPYGDDNIGLLAEDAVNTDNTAMGNASYMTPEQLINGTIKDVSSPMESNTTTVLNTTLPINSTAAIGNPNIQDKINAMEGGGVGGVNRSQRVLNNTTETTSGADHNGRGATKGLFLTWSMSVSVAMVTFTWWMV